MEKMSYERTFRVFKHKLREILKNYTNSEQYSYSLHGFSHAIIVTKTILYIHFVNYVIEN